MLRQVLRELESARSAVNLNELSRKLGIERSALEAMVDYLVRKGELRDDDKAAEEAMAKCGSASCGSSCPGPQGCPFVMKMPRTFSLAVCDETGQGTASSQ
jgi:hypothetical protein